MSMILLLSIIFIIIIGIVVFRLIYCKKQDKKLEKYTLRDLDRECYTSNSCKNQDIKLENTKVESTTNNNIKKYTLTDLDREFYISTPTCLKNNLPIILLFHGGGEVAWDENGTGIMNYTDFFNTNSICISISRSNFK